MPKILIFIIAAMSAFPAFADRTVLEPLLKGPACEQLFTKARFAAKESPEVAADGYLWHLQAYSTAINFHASQGTQADPKMPALIEAMDVSAQRYLAAQGLRVVKKIPAEKPTRDGEVIHYHRFELEGAADGSRLSRTIRAFQLSPRFADFRLSVILDPLLSAHLGFLRNNEIHLAPSGLVNSRIGASHVFRHELQHYFGARRVKRGESSLMRILVVGGRYKRAVGYDEYFHGDEIEASLRDLRSSLYHDENPRLTDELFASGFADKARDAGFTKGDFKVSDDDKRTRRLEKEKSLHFFIASTLQALDIAESEILRRPNITERILRRRPYRVDQGIVVMKLPLSADYERLQLDLSGTSATPSSTRAEVDAVVLDIIRSSRARIQQVESEARILREKI